VIGFSRDSGAIPGPIDIALLNKESIVGLGLDNGLKFKTRSR